MLNTKCKLVSCDNPVYTVQFVVEGEVIHSSETWYCLTHISPIFKDAFINSLLTGTLDTFLQHFGRTYIMNLEVAKNKFEHPDLWKITKVVQFI